MFCSADCGNCFFAYKNIVFPAVSSRLGGCRRFCGNCSYYYRSVYFAANGLVFRIEYAVFACRIFDIFLFFLPAKKIKLPVFIACAVIAGGTVGSFEAVMYFVAGTHYSALRLCTAAVLHALCAGLSGIFVWTAKNKTRKRKAQFAAFCAAVFCHGIYNFFAGFNGFLWWFSLAALLFALIQLRSFYTES